MYEKVSEVLFWKVFIPRWGLSKAKIFEVKHKASLKPPNNWNRKFIPFPQFNTVILPPVPQT